MQLEYSHIATAPFLHSEPYDLEPQKGGWWVVKVRFTVSALDRETVP